METAQVILQLAGHQELLKAEIQRIETDLKGLADIAKRYPERKELFTNPQKDLRKVKTAKEAEEKEIRMHLQCYDLHRPTGEKLLTKIAKGQRAAAAVSLGDGTGSGGGTRASVLDRGGANSARPLSSNARGGASSKHTAQPQVSSVSAVSAGSIRPSDAAMEGARSSRTASSIPSVEVYQVRSQDVPRMGGRGAGGGQLESRGGGGGGGGYDESSAAVSCSSRAAVDGSQRNETSYFRNHVGRLGVAVGSGGDKAPAAAGGGGADDRGHWSRQPTHVGYSYLPAPSITNSSSTAFYDAMGGGASSNVDSSVQ